ncbi:MAG: sulfatase [Flammeovirgaceae bacterium]|nr:sulfatase [Flammeovirgaceae bacterium]
MKLVHANFRSILVFFLIPIYIWSCQSKQSEEKMEEKSSGEKLPNIVIIFADDLGYADVGLFGAKGFTTPNIDNIASNGAKFTNFYVSQPVCSASRASLLTGCYANRVGVSGAFSPYRGIGLNPEEETIAEILKPLGYKTAIYGKWHLGSEPEFLPTRQGFDEYFGIPFSNDMWSRHPENEHHNFGALPLIENENIIDTLEEQSQITTWYTERAVNFIDKNKDGPFFLYLPHSMPHVPLFVSDKFKGKSEKGLYGDVIMEIDWSVGQVMKALKRNGIEENTLVIFTSDNGPWLSYGGHSGSALPLREGKGSAWEGGVRVPCVMQWPGNIPKGVEIDEALMTIDVLPTIATITGAELPKKKIDGKNILPVLKNEENATSPHDALFFYYKSNELHSMLSGNWKMYFPHNYRTLAGAKGRNDGIPIKYSYVDLEEVELYDIENDISEKKNVATENPDIVAKMAVLADEMRKELGDKLTKTEGSGNRPLGRIASEGK